jgi:hypothetical protein
MKRVYEMWIPRKHNGSDGILRCYDSMTELQVEAKRLLRPGESAEVTAFGNLAVLGHQTLTFSRLYQTSPAFDVEAYITSLER